MNYADLHADTIEVLYHQNAFQLKDGPFQISIDKLKQGQCILQCFALFIHLNHTNKPLEECLRMMDYYYQELEKNRFDIAPVFSFSDIEKNKSEGKISSLLTIEEGAATLGEPAILRMLYRLGVRMICLTWNFENELGYPSQYYQKSKTNNKKVGLKQAGFEMIREMNRLGMIVDVSHLSDQGFYDVLATTTKPIVASHSNARSICPHPRNLTDDMILKLAANGGVMGMNFYAPFLAEQDGNQTIHQVIKHMLYIKKLAGVEVISLGSDFDGINSEIELKDAARMQKLFIRMREVGFTEEEIKKIAYQNFFRVLKANLT